MAEGAFRLPLPALLPALLCGTAALAGGAGIARAEDGPAPALAVSGSYVADAVGVVDGTATGLRYVDLLTVAADLDLARATGWSGARFHAAIQSQHGGQPNTLAGTLEGIDNSEVSLNRVRLFEAFLEQDFARLGATARAGFIDLNDEFYATDSASLLLAPPFGIGSELAATGSLGPSIYPSTAPALTVRVKAGAHGYVQIGAFNARAGTLGDPGGVPPLLREGALLVAEAGVSGTGRSGKGKLALGGWPIPAGRTTSARLMRMAIRCGARFTGPMCWPSNRWVRTS